MHFHTYIPKLYIHSAIFKKFDLLVYKIIDPKIFSFLSNYTKDFFVVFSYFRLVIPKPDLVSFKSNFGTLLHFLISISLSIIIIIIINIMYSYAIKYIIDIFLVDNGKPQKKYFFYGRAIKTLSKFFLYNLSLNIRPFTPPLPSRLPTIKKKLFFATSLTSRRKIVNIGFCLKKLCKSKCREKKY